MAVHAGEARTATDGNYAGQAIIRTARLRAITNGGQILVSEPARDLVIDHLGDKVTLVDLGEHRLRDLARPERVYQVTGSGLPERLPAAQLAGRHRHNLPIQLSSFVGRLDDIATVADLDPRESSGHDRGRRGFGQDPSRASGRGGARRPVDGRHVVG